MKSLKIHLIIEQEYLPFFLLLNVLFIFLFNFTKTQSCFHEKYFFYSSIQSIPAILKNKYRCSEKYTNEDYQEYTSQIVEIEACVKISLKIREGKEQFVFKGFFSHHFFFRTLNLPSIVSRIIL